MNPKQNLVPYYSRLSQKEKAVLLYLLNRDPPGGVDHGTLPFVALDRVITRCQMVADAQVEKYERVAREILTKLMDAVRVRDAKGKFNKMMHLDPGKVYKHFGKNPGRGKPLPHLPKVQVTAGVKWSLPKQKWIPDDKVFVTPCVSLRQIKGHLYEIQVINECRYAVELWLMDNCR